jgi:hypothetical protein
MCAKLALAIALFGLSPRWGLSAQTPDSPLRGFGISPTALTLQGRPGSTVQGSFNILSEGTEQVMRCDIRIADLGQTTTSSISPVRMGQGARSCAVWITVPNRIILRPNERQNVPFSVTVPAGARGGYHAFIVVEYIPAAPTANMSAVLKPSIAIRVALNVPGRGPLRVDVSELSLQAGAQGAPPAIVLKAANAGIWKTSVEGDVLLYGGAGTWPIRASMPYPRGGKPIEIYPGLGLDLRCPLPRAVPSGEYRALVRLLMNGKYQTRSWFELHVPTKQGEEPVWGTLLQKSELDVPLIVQPDVVEINTPPGARRSVAIGVKNDGDGIVDLRIDVADVKLELDGMVTFPESSAGNPAAWVAVSPEELTLQASGRTAIRAMVVVPRNTSGGGTMVKAVRIRAVGSRAGDNEGWTSAAEFAVMIVAQDPKAPPASLETVTCEVLRPRSGHNPTAGVLRVRNTGGRAAKATGRITLERTSGQEIAHMDIGAAQPELILPGGEREFRMPIPPLDKGKFRIRAEISPGPGGGEKAVAVEEFETYIDIPEGLRDAVETPPATEPGESDTGAEKKPETPPAPDASREGDFRP